MGSRFSIPIPKGTAVEVDEVRDRLQGRRHRRQDRPEDGRDVGRLADHDAALRLRPRRRRQARLERLGLLHLVQHRAGHREAGGHRVAAGPRLHRGRRLEDGGAARGEGRGPDDRRHQGHRPREEPRPRLLHALRQVAARRRRLPRRQVRHRLRQAPGRHHRLQLGEGPDRDAEQGLHRRRGRHPGPEVRVDQGRRGPGRPRAAAHPVRTGRLRLHLALRGQRDRQVEARDLGGRGQGPDVLLDRPPLGGRGRHGEPGRQVAGRASTSSPTAGTSASAPRSPSPASSWTSPRRR